MGHGLTHAYFPGTLRARYATAYKSVNIFHDLTHWNGASGQLCMHMLEMESCGRWAMRQMSMTLHILTRQISFPSFSEERLWKEAKLSAQFVF